MMSAQGRSSPHASARRCEGYIKAGVEEGAKVAVGGKRPAGLAEGVLRRADHPHRREELA